MTKRLQVLLDEDELGRVQAAAREQRLTTAEWVRRSLRTSLETERSPNPSAILEALAVASRYAFPVGDIDQMLVAEIDGRVLGVVTVDGDLVDLLWVASESRGQGLGRQDGHKGRRALPALR